MIEISVVIPTYDRVDRLRACLESLAHQTHPAADFEVVVVVDGSTDGTLEMLAAYAPPYTLRVIQQENSGQSAALNRGVAAARGRWCLLLDDDMLVDRALVAEHVRAQREQANMVVLGQIKLALTPHADWFARCFEQGWGKHYQRLNQGVRPLSWTDCYSGNMSVAREAFLAVGGFRLDLARSYDVELGYRFQQYGLRFAYLAAAVSTQDEQKGWRELTTDAVKAGTASVALCRRYPPMLAPLLGTWNDTSLRAITVRRVLLMLHTSPRLVAWIGRLVRLPSTEWEWFRFVYAYCFWYGVRRALPDRHSWRRLISGTPILMYHAVGGATEPASRYIIPARRFAWQMAWLRWCRYQVISLEALLAYRRDHRLPPARAVVITFDDGYADNGTLAYPILRKHGFPATIFLVSQAVGTSNQWDAPIGGALVNRPLLGWAAIRTLLQHGITFGAHTRTHPALTSLPHTNAQREITGSRADLERELQHPMRVFAYPYGKHDRATEALVQAAGYEGACSVHEGLNTLTTSPWALRRIEVHGTDSFVRFVLGLVIGHTEWIWQRKPQHSRRR